MRPPEATEEDEAVPRKRAEDGRRRKRVRPRSELRPFDLHALIEATTAPLAAAGTAKQLAVEVKLADGLPRRVVGDADGVRETLAALFENAVTFTERGEVFASISSRETGSGRAIVRFEISDTGPGASAEALTGSAKGGLARSRKLVERMDGRLECASAAGLGSTICFDVPVDLGS